MLFGYTRGLQPAFIIASLPLMARALPQLPSGNRQLTDSQYGRFGSGKPVRRIEDQSLLLGQGAFADDVNWPGQAHLLFLRSPYPHARIRSIDTAAAAAMPGILRVITGQDLVDDNVQPMPGPTPFPRPDGKPGVSPPRRGLAHEVVRFVGEAVVAVVADSPDRP